MIGATTGDPGELALVFSGGGARGAYQVGFLRYLARRHPHLQVPILTGVSAGALNAIHLANHTGNLGEKVEALSQLWTELSIEQVLRTDAPALAGRVLLWLAQLGLWGGIRAAPNVRGLLDTAPLGELLHRVLASPDGGLPGIERNLTDGGLRAVAVTTTHYHTGQTVTWCQGRDVRAWDRPQRRSEHTKLRVEHAFASAALPIFFPAVRIGPEWYGDGAIRLHSPLAPAVHLGASRIVAISTRYGGAPKRPSPAGAVAPYPPPSRVLGVMLNAIFLDLLDQDALRLQRVNRLLAGRAGPAPEGLRRIELRVLRPSQDLAEIAMDHEAGLPRAFRFLLRRLGTRETHADDLLSLLLFQGAYLRRLIELGEADAEARADEIEELLALDARGSVPSASLGEPA